MVENNKNIINLSERNMDSRDTTTSSSAVNVERRLLTTTWVKESELILEFIPEDDLTQKQVKLLDKCVNREEFTDKQLSELKLVLNKYRKFLHEIRPDKTLDTVETTVQMMKTESDFISLMSADEQKRLLVHIQTYAGVKGFDFIVLPISDSRVIDSLEMQVDLFRDYSNDEQVIYAKASSGNKLTAEEEGIYKRMQEEIIKKQSSERIKSINVFLANQLILEGSDSSLDERIRFWEVFPFVSKVGVFIRVQDMLGLTDAKNSELFPTRR